MNNSSIERLDNLKYAFLNNGGESAKVIRSTDWSQTALGPLNKWPQSLRTILGVCLNSPTPSLVFWGCDLIQFYNDASLPFIPLTQLSSFGVKAEEAWSGVWNTMGPVVKNVLAKGKEASWTMQHTKSNGNFKYGEDFTISFSPIYDESDGVGGVYCIVEATRPDGTKTSAVSNHLERARIRIEENEKQFKNVLLQSPAIFLMLSGPEMRIVFANEPLLMSWGRTEEEIFGKPLVEALPEIIDQPFPKLLQEVYRTGKSNYGKEEKAVLIKNGIPVDTYYNYVYQPRYGDDNTISGITVMANDVTESVIARQKIQESEKRLLLIADALPVLISYVDRNERYQFNNKAYERWFGHTLEEIKGKHMSEVLGAEAYTTLKPNIDEALSGVAVKFDSQVRYKDVGNKFITADYIPHKDENGEVLGFYVLVDDVSQRTIAEQTLKQSEEKYRSLFESMDQGFCIVEILFDENRKPHDYRFMEVNPVFEKHTHLKNPVGKTARELVPDLEEQWIQVYGNVALTGQSSRFMEGSEAMGLWFEVYAFRIGESENSQVAILFTDITTRRQSEITLMESELRFRTLADNAPMFVFIMEPNEHASISYWNKTWLTYTGQSLEEALGRAWDDIIHEEDVTTVLKHYLPAFENHQPYYIPPVRTRRYDGQYRWYSFKADPRFSADGTFNGYVGVGFDVHEQKLAEEKLEMLVQERTKQLQRSNDDLQQFAHVASHDLKEPLRKIKTFAYRLEDEFIDAASNQARTYIKKILSASDRLTSMVDGVLTFSKADDVHQKIEFIDLNKIVADIKADLEVLITQKSATVVTDVLPSIEGAEILIYQLFYNLINNAIKFSKYNVDPIIRISAQVNNGFAVIDVNDNGIGFAPEYEEKIFETFLRLNSKDKYEGSGLGLALCKKITLRHHGMITAKGVLGHGATFTVSLPLRQV